MCVCVCVCVCVCAIYLYFNAQYYFHFQVKIHFSAFYLWWSLYCVLFCPLASLLFISKLKTGKFPIISLHTFWVQFSLTAICLQKLQWILSCHFANSRCYLLRPSLQWSSGHALDSESRVKRSILLWGKFHKKFTSLSQAVPDSIQLL